MSRFNLRSPLQLLLSLFGLLFGMPALASLWGQGLEAYILISLILSFVGIRHLVREHADSPFFEEKMKIALLVLRRKEVTARELAEEINTTFELTWKIIDELQRRQLVSRIRLQK